MMSEFWKSRLADYEILSEPGHIKITIKTMNTPPGNPTETETVPGTVPHNIAVGDPAFYSDRRSDPELKRLEDLVLEDNEAIKTQQHIKWLADVEISRRKRSLKATLASIETITKGPES